MILAMPLRSEMEDTWHGSLIPRVFPRLNLPTKHIEECCSQQGLGLQAILKIIFGGGRFGMHHVPRKTVSMADRPQQFANKMVGCS